MKNRRLGHNDHNDGWTLSKFFILRFFGKKMAVIPHYEFYHGIEMDADLELIEIIIDYLQKKKDYCEEEFKKIGNKSE